MGGFFFFHSRGGEWMDGMRGGLCFGQLGEGIRGSDGNVYDGIIFPL